MLRLFNTLTRRKEEFRPIDSGNVRVYACGPTVYDLAHIGNARPVIVFDLLFRLLRRLYGPDHVAYVRNVTDVDDKINARAARDFPGVPLNEAIARVTRDTERQFQADVRALGVLTPADVVGSDGRSRMVEPRATEHVAEMRAIVDRLLAAGHAYAAEGHVLFHVPSWPDYGGLSRRPLDEMEAGARVDVAPFKRSPLDFVLWKPSGPEEPGWPSPGGLPGLGRPGWHIECSAMAWTHLGETFDIHAGGLDLIFPHHENEIAQSRCGFGTPVMANYWLHNGFLQVEGAKMSKSLGNFVTIRDVLRDWPGEVIRLAMLRTHYRQPIDWTVRALEESERTLDRWNAVAADASSARAGPPDAAVLDALCDDLNTPAAIVRLHSLFSGENDPETAAGSARLLGLLAGDAASWTIRKRPLAVAADVIEARISDRLAARAAKDWAASDRIRDELKAMGIQLKDNKDGTTSWEVAR